MKKLKIYRQVSIFTFLLLLPFCSLAQTPEANQYKIVNDIADLSDGDHIIIVSKFHSKAMTDTVNISSQKNQRLSSTYITLNDDKTIAYTNVESAVFTLVKNNDKFNIRSNSGKYITNVSADKDNKDVNLCDEISASTEAEISFDNGKANILYVRPYPKYLYCISTSKLFGISNSPSSADSYIIHIYKLYTSVS